MQERHAREIQFAPGQQRGRAVRNGGDRQQRSLDQAGVRGGVRYGDRRVGLAWQKGRAGWSWYAVRSSRSS